jgi:hypothetical protein
MDGESFDRLSVVVHRLRDQATRRGALRLLAGGVVALASELLADADDAEAKKRHNNKRHRRNNKKYCRGFGGRCYSHRDCCNGRCFGGFCFGSGGGGGGKHCGGRKCPAGWSCCRANNVSVCTPNNFPTCCGNVGYAPGFSCCNAHHGGACPGGFGCTDQFGLCCQPGWTWCANSGRCCPSGWFCGDIACYAYQTADVSGESVESVPFADPVRISEQEWTPLPE